MFLALAFGPSLIRRLRELQIGQFIREEGPQEHKKKAGTPTMGGVLIVLSTAVPTLLWADLQNPFILLSLFALVGFAVIGFHRRLRESLTAAQPGSHRKKENLFPGIRQPGGGRFAAGPDHPQRILHAVDDPLSEALSTRSGHPRLPSFAAFLAAGLLFPFSCLSAL